MRKTELFVGQRVQGWTALRGTVVGTVVEWGGSPDRVYIKLEEDAEPIVDFVQARGHAGYKPKVRPKGMIVDIGIINVTPIDIKPPEKRERTPAKKESGVITAECMNKAIKADKQSSQKSKKPYLAHAPAETTKKSGTLKGETVYVTGKDEIHSKDQLKAIVLAHGGNWGWTAKTTILVVAGHKAGPSKRADVEKRGIKMIGMQDFLEMIGENE
jgi:NAD-dependent DNA ligase